jgi:mono/diheme cytochrome c family protein
MLRNTALFLILGSILAALTIISCGPRPASRGAQVYADYCTRCHGTDGAGGEGLYGLVGRAIWTMPKDSLVRTLVYGAGGSRMTEKDGVRMGMPPAPYTDEEIAEVATYVYSAIGKRTVTVTVQDVQAVRRAQAERLRMLKEVR